MARIHGAETPTAPRKGDLTPKCPRLHKGERLSDEYPSQTGMVSQLKACVVQVWMVDVRVICRKEKQLWLQMVFDPSCSSALPLVLFVIHDSVNVVFVSGVLCCGWQLLSCFLSVLAVPLLQVLSCLLFLFLVVVGVLLICFSVTEVFSLNVVSLFHCTPGMSCLQKFGSTLGQLSVQFMSSCPRLVTVVCLRSS